MQAAQRVIQIITYRPACAMRAPRLARRVPPQARARAVTRAAIYRLARVWSARLDATHAPAPQHANLVWAGIFTRPRVPAPRAAQAALRAPAQPPAPHA